jgi:hypothetical protein
VDRSGDCWLWTASDTGVYGQFHPTNGRRVYAHRFAYELTYGPIPAGLFICHHCDVPLCVRPAHLYAGTRADNVRDMLTRGRNAKGERHISRTHPERMRRGETHHRTTVTTEQVREMRRLAADGVPTPVIAERFGVARETAGKIIRRQRWQHVE